MISMSDKKWAKAEKKGSGLISPILSNLPAIGTPQPFGLTPTALRNRHNSTRAGDGGARSCQPRWADASLSGIITSITSLAPVGLFTQENG
jgi:hypothetical protein